MLNENDIIYLQIVFYDPQGFINNTLSGVDNFLETRAVRLLDTAPAFTGE